MNRRLITEVVFKAIALLFLLTALFNGIATLQLVSPVEWTWAAVARELDPTVVLPGLLMALVQAAAGVTLLMRAGALADRVLPPGDAACDGASSLALGSLGVGLWGAVHAVAQLVALLGTVRLAPRDPLEQASNLGRIELPLLRIMIFHAVMIAVSLLLVLGRKGVASLWARLQGAGSSSAPVSLAATPREVRTLVSVACGVLGLWFALDALVGVSSWFGGGSGGLMFGVGFGLGPDGLASVAAHLVKLAAGLLLFVGGGRVADWWSRQQRSAGAVDLEAVRDAPTA